MKNLLIFSITGLLSLTISAQDPVSIYQEGLQLKQQSKVFEASQKFSQALEIKPGYTEALYELGWCKNDLKDYNGALNALREVLTSWSTVPKVSFELAFAFEKSNMVDSAIYYYSNCVSLKPDYSGAYKQLGYIYYTKFDYTNALDQFAKYEENNKNDITDYYYWYRKGYAQNAIKDYSNAKNSLKSSIENKDDYLHTYLELGYACSKLNEDDEAISYYQKAIDLDPKNHIGYNGIAEIYRDNKKDPVMAMTWYQKTLAINPNERKANFGMGYCKNSTEKYAEAIPYLKKAIEMEDGYTAAYIELGYSYYKNGSNAEAINNFDQALKLNPQNENARYYKCLVYVSQNDRTNAQKMVDELNTLGSKYGNSLQERINKM